MISQKMKYALKALVVLAEERMSEGSALRIGDIAERSGAPKRFLEHILLDLRNAGILASSRGRNGGYVLARAPKAVALSEVMRMIDGPIAPLPCLSRRSYERCADCPDERACRIRKVFAEVFWSYLVLIESLSLADFIERPAEILALAEAG